MNNKFVKNFEGIKVVGSGKAINDDQLQAINKFTLIDIPIEQLYVRKMRLAHNAIDRDEERFSDDILKDFANTLPGKSLLIGHQWGPPGKGLFYKAWIETKSIEEANEETGGKLILPKGVDKVKFLMTEFYTVKTDSKIELLADIDAGIIRHVSIGFDADKIVEVVDEKTGVTLYHEYKSPGEAFEGSLVWLGAQPGTTITKTLKKDSVNIDKKITSKAKGATKMIKLLNMLGLDNEASEEAALKKLNNLIARVKFIEPIVEALGGDDVTAEDVSKIKELANDGKAYKKDLIDCQVKAERLLGRIDDTEESATERVKQLEVKTASEISDDVVFLGKQVDEKFPDEGKIKGKSGNESRDNEECSKKFDFRKKEGGNI